jgi:hypothetical protein
LSMRLRDMASGRSSASWATVTEKEGWRWTLVKEQGDVSNGEVGALVDKRRQPKSEPGSCSDIIYI